MPVGSGVSVKLRGLLGPNVVGGTVVRGTAVGGESVCCVFAAQVEYTSPALGGL